MLMFRGFSRIIVLAVGLVFPVGLLAFEPLSEDELDRTVASGMEAPVPMQRIGPAKGATADRKTETDGVRVVEDETSDADDVTFIAYREALPIVMSRMTNTPRGPLGAHGSYSLAPIVVVRDQGPPANLPVVLPLGSLPTLNPPLFIGR